MRIRELQRKPKKSERISPTARLNAEGRRTRTPWAPGTLQAILTRPLTRA